MASTLHHGFDSKKVFALMAVAFTAGSALFVAAVMSIRDEFRDDRVILNRPWPFRSASYPYGRVVALARVARFQAPNGNILSRPYHAIRFDDGQTWAPHGFLPDGPRDEAILALVSERSGRPIQELDLIDEMKP
jgi:hypothetical protein